MKVDLVMWAKDGERYLPQVLKRIDEVIPSENVDQKILVDDHSVDRTVEIAKDFNWKIFENPETGVASGANEALRHVRREFFISFEQDLLLAKNWWDVVPNLLLSSKKVAIASGVRLPDRPYAIRILNEYEITKYKEREESDLGRTLDNTIYKTKILRDLGGFPKIKVSSGVDTVLAYRIKRAGFKWRVTTQVRSIHIREGLWQELKHYYWYATNQYEASRILCREKPSLFKYARIAITSPMRGFHLAIKLKCPNLLYVYPLIRFIKFKGIADGLKKGEIVPHR